MELTNPESGLPSRPSRSSSRARPVDNIIFISILSGKLPADQQPRARRIGLLVGW